VRLTVVTHESPYPPNHGGRADVWHRLVALRKRGVDVQLVVWMRKNGTANELEVLRSVLSDVVTLRRRVSRVILWRGKYVPRMLTFETKGADRSKLLRSVTAFAPDAILLDSWPAYLTAKDIAERLDRPLLYRSHNIEHLYLREQQRLSTGLTRLKLRLNCYGIEGVEKEIRSRAVAVFDICSEDADYWTNLRSDSTSKVLPPLWVEETTSNTGSFDQRQIDVLFAGNLWTPNNVDGLVWFSTKVLPRLRAEFEGPLKVVYAGSRPSKRFQDLCREYDVKCVPDPPTLIPFIRDARVVINPIANASGVNVKMLPLIEGGGHVIATNAAVRGLPQEIVGFCRVVSDPNGFAEQVIRALKEPGPLDTEARRRALQQHFGPSALDPLLEQVTQLS
jgi:polysaccharide biosynthesis protein PslH